MGIFGIQMGIFVLSPGTSRIFSRGKGKRKIHPNPGICSRKIWKRSFGSSADPELFLSQGMPLEKRIFLGMCSFQRLWEFCSFQHRNSGSSRIPKSRGSQARSFSSSKFQGNPTDPKPAREFPGKSSQLESRGSWNGMGIPWNVPADIPGFLLSRAGRDSRFWDLCSLRAGIPWKTAGIPWKMTRNPWKTEHSCCSLFLG